MLKDKASFYCRRTYKVVRESELNFCLKLLTCDTFLRRLAPVVIFLPIYAVLYAAGGLGLVELI